MRLKFRKQSFLRTLSRQFWGFVVCTIIALAVLVQIGRMAFPLVDDYRHVLEEALGEQLGVAINIDELRAEWQGLRPKIILHGLRVSSVDQADTIFTVNQALAELSLIDSIIQGGLAWRTIEFNEFETTFAQNEHFGWSLKGYDGGTANSDNPFLFDDPLDIFLFGRRVEITSATLNFDFISGKKTDLLIPVISLENDRFFHRVRAELDSGDSKLLELVIEGYGDPRDRDSFSASGYIGLNDVPLENVFGAVLKERPDRQLLEGKEYAHLDLKFWFRGNPRAGMLGKGRIEVSGFPALADSELSLPSSLSSELGGAWKEGAGGYLSFQGLNVDWGESVFPISAFSLFAESGQWGMRLPELDVLHLIEIFTEANPNATELVGRYVSGMQPTGKIKNLDVRVTSKEEGWFHARAFLENAGISAYKDIPGISGADAYVEANLNSGFFDVQSQSGFSLALPKSFENTFDFEQLSGRLYWGLDLDKQILTLNSSTSRATIDGAEVSGAFALVQGLKKGVVEPYLSLQLYSERAEAKGFWRYLPNNTPSELIDWLKASDIQGTVTEIGVLYNGSVAKTSEFLPTYQVSANAEDLMFRFEPSWPAIKNGSGAIYLDSRDFSAELYSADIMGNAIDSVVLVTEPSANTEDVNIHIEAKLAGETDLARKLLLSSSLKEQFSGFLDEWRFTGNYTGALALDIPVGANVDNTNVLHNIDVQLHNNTLWAGQLELDATDIYGHFNSSTDNLFNASELKAKVWQRDFNLSAGSANELQDIHIQFLGEVNVASLKQWSQRPELDFLSGDTQVNGSVTVPTSDESQHEAILVSMRSSLLGSAIDLPEPFAKDANQLGDYRLDIHVFDELIRYRYHHDNLLNAEIISKEQSLPAIAINFDRQQPNMLPALEYGKVNALGRLESADYDQWLLAIDRYVEASDAIEQLVSTTDTFSQIDEEVETQLDLFVSDFTIGELEFEDVAFDIVSATDEWIVGAKSDTFVGDVFIPIEDKPVRLDFEYLSILENEIPPEELEGVEEVSALSDIDLSEIGAMQVSIRNLKIENSDWGRWVFDVAPIENGLHFFNLKANVKGLNIGREQNADFIWEKVGEQNKSRFVGKVEVGDTLDALRAWELEEIVTSDEGNFDVDITWFAEPDMIALENISGDVTLSLSNGSFLEADEAGENPALRLMALLNFDTFARRLRFDFSDLAAKGFHYDTVKTQIKFSEGTADLTQPLEVVSSSSKMKMTGTLDLVNEEVDGHLVVTLPVGGNLAFATAFAAGLPAAVGVYAISKLFNKQVDKATSINYRVTGAWEDPKLKVRRSKKK